MQEESLEERAIRTYNENLLFFQATQPQLFEKLDALTHAIDKGFYAERYSLEYNDDYFDVLEIESGNFLYGSSSNKHAKQAAESIDYKKTGNLYETFYNVTISDEFAEELIAGGIEKNSYSGAASLINYSNKNADKDTSMKKLYKFIFIGVGLGLHITEIHNRLKSNVYFIVENDLELFRLSLFVTNYKDLTKDGAELVFSVFDDETGFKNRTNIFLHMQFVYNHYIKYFHMLSHDDKKLKELQSIVVGQRHLTFNYSALTTSLLRPLIHLQNGYRLLDIKSSYTQTPFQTKPVLILGAGPSFQHNIEWLKKNQNKFIIVAVSALLSKLEELNIKPDIITHIHGFSDAIPHVKKVKDMGFFDKTISIFGGFAEPEFIDYFKKKNMFIFEGNSRYKENFGGLTSSNIGTVSYLLLLTIQTKNIYLLGLDFAMDQESGQTHADTHEYVKNIELKEDDTLGGDLSYSQTVIKVDGNHREKVFSTLLMDGWRHECNIVSKTIRTSKNENVYNLADGAYIDETIPRKVGSSAIESLDTIDKDELYNNLIDLFNAKSEDFLNENEIKGLHERVAYCNNIINTINEHTNKNHQDLNNYHYNLLGLFQELLSETKEKSSSDMDFIITMYMQFISGYIFDLINTKEITNSKKLIKHLDKIIMPQMIRVVSHFKDSIEKYLDSRI